MNAYVLDTSVAIAWYLDEVFSPAAGFGKSGSGREGHLHCPLPPLLEFANVLRTLVWRRELQEELAREILDLHLEAPLEQSEPDRRTVLDTALEYKPRPMTQFLSACVSPGDYH